MKQKLCTKWGLLDADVDLVDIGICRYTGEVYLWLQRCNLVLSLWCAVRICFVCSYEPWKRESVTSASHISEVEELESSANIWSIVGSGQLTCGRAAHETVLLHVLGKGVGKPKNFLAVCGSSRV